MKSEKISFRFVRGVGAAIANVNGYWVYVTPAGKLLVEMFYQHPRRTDSITLQLNEDGSLGKELERESPETILREILVGMELTPELALEFGQYLVDTVQSMRGGSSGVASSGTVTKQ